MAILLAVAPYLTGVITVASLFVWVGRLAQRVDSIDEIKADLKQVDAKVDDVLFLLARKDYGESFKPKGR
jgi:hypothetical protein